MKTDNKECASQRCTQSIKSTIMMAKTLFTLVLLACSANALAYDFMVDGLCYDICSNSESVAVTYESLYSDNYEDLQGDIVIPQKVKHIGKSYDVVMIGHDAFRGCSGLTSVTIPNSVTTIATDAFFGCYSLSTIMIPESVTKIGIRVFGGCLNLLSIHVDPLNTTFDSRENCNAIIETATNSLIVGCKNTQMPASIRTIAPSAFYDSSELLTLTIPDSVTEIGSFAFHGCTGLVSVTIPPSVTKIGSDAFSACSGLASVNIPPSVTEIGRSAFDGCTGLASVVIPYSVNKIDFEAFYDCTNLKSIICSISTPQNTITDFTAFRGVDRQTCHLMVPQGSLESYSSASPWLYFANKSEDASLVCDQTQTQSADMQESLSLEEQFQSYCDEQQYDKAIDIGERLMAEPESKHVNNHLIKELADCYYEKKDFGKAKEYYEILVRDNSDSFTNEMLGNCCMNMNDYVSAEKYFLQAYDELLSDTTTTIVSSIPLLLKIHNCYFNQGKFLEAVDTYIECQSIIPKVKSTSVLLMFLKGHMEWALMENLRRIIQTGDNLCNQGLYDEVQDLYANAIVYFQKINGAQSREEAVINERIGRCYLMMRQYSIAHDYLNRSRKIFEKDEIDSYLKLNRYLSKKKIKTLLKNPKFYKFHELYDMLNNVPLAMTGFLGRKRILAEDLILDYGIYYASQCIADSSYAYIGSSVDHIYDNSIDFFGNNTSADRSAYWEKYSHLFCEIYPYVVLMAAEEHKNKEEFDSTYRDLYGDLYNKSALFAKGLLLTSDNEFRRIIYESGDSILISRLKELETLANAQGPLFDEKKEEIESKAQELEKELIYVSKDYNEFMTNLQLTWQDVQSRLGDNDIAVEFLSFPKLGSDSVFYIALTLRKEYDIVIIDSAPIAMVSDTFSLAKYGDTTLFVMRAKYTKRSLIKYFNSVVARKQFHNAAVVLNDSNPKLSAGYGYGYGKEKG